MKEENGSSKSEILGSGASIEADGLSIQLNPSSSTQGISALFEESSQTARFVIKLLTEMSFLKAEKATLKVEGDILRVSLRSADDELKSFSLNKTWLSAISRWLCDRYSIFHAQHTLSQSKPQFAASSFDFYCAVKVEGDLLQFRVRKNTHLNGAEMLSLSNLSSLQMAAALNQLDLTGPAHALVSSVLAKENAFMLVAAPDENNLWRSLAAVLSLSNAHYIPTCSFNEFKQSLPELCKGNLLLFAVKSVDAVDAAFKFRDMGADLSSEAFAGVLCQGFVRKVCESCARSASAEPTMLELLPATLRQPVRSGYCVGRGCERCGHSGYAGLLSLQSVFSADEVTRSLFSSVLEPGALLEHLYARGTKPLLEDGARKVAQGKLTLESLFELTKNMPAAYAKFYLNKDGNAGAKPILSGGLDLGDSADERVTQARNAVLSGKANPLMPVRENREKPLLMVVEDNADQQSILEMVFKSANYDVVLAGDGVEAFELMKQAGVPDLMVVDLMMPRMDGREFIKRVKEDEIYRNIPLLVLTVISDSDKEYDMLDLGADDYCEKTIQRKILLKRVANLLKRTRG